MTFRPEHQTQTPVLVLGIGNQLLWDDGVGLVMLARLRERWGADSRVDFVDGGTQGIALATYLADRRAVLVLDAVALGGAAGTVHARRNVRACDQPRGSGAHEGNAGELLAVAELVGDVPEQMAIVGIEPEALHTGIGLSAKVEAALPEATDAAERMLHELLAFVADEASSCTK